MEFLRSLFVRGSPVANTTPTSILTKIDKHIVPAIETKLTQIDSHIEAIQIGECYVDSHLVPEIKVSRKQNRKNRKYLTTCRHCGHYRFAKKNSKRIVNPNYPYEHSVKGGCTVLSIDRIAIRDRLRRLCNCVFCKDAAENFMNEVPGLKKKNQFFYERTLQERLSWEIMKKNGWRCRYGKYYPPSERFNTKGMEREDAFRPADI